MTRPLFSHRPLGFDPRWIVRHAARCGRPDHRLSTPRYIGGWLPPGLEMEPSQEPSPAARPGLSFGAYRALRRRLDRWELEHLREHAADLAARLEVAERHRCAAEDEADHWREQCLAIELRDDERLAMTVDGFLHVVASPSSAKGAAA